MPKSEIATSILESSDQIPRAIRDCFVADPDGSYDGNVADAIVSLGTSITRAASSLGNAGASTPMGALEAHGAAILEAADKLAPAMNDIASAFERIADSLEKIAARE